MILIVGTLLLVGGGAGVAVWYARGTTPVVVETKADSRLISSPTSLPATMPATQAATPPPASYVELVRAIHPSLAVKEPLAVPLDLSEAMHVRLNTDAFVCGRGDLWVTHPEAPPTSTVLAKSYDEQTHLIRESVAFVWWRDDGQGDWSAWVATRTPDGYEWITATARLPMPTGETLDWQRAIFWGDDALAVPTDRGVAIVRVAPKPSVDPVTLLAPNDGTPLDPLGRPQLFTDGQGVLAWVPPGADGTPRGTHVARYVDGKWTTLDATDWPTTIVHVIPLVDGSVLRMTASGAGKIALSLVPLAASGVDEQAVVKLVEQLSEPDPRHRLAAYKELTRYGPAVWPVLERLRDEQPPEAQLRIGQLLRDRTTPTLGGMTPVDGVLRVVGRDRLGGAVVYADKGVTMGDDTGKSETISPAWVAIRPGRAPELLPPAMVTDLRPDRHAIDVHLDRWVVTDAVNGPRLYLGRSFTKLLRDDERAFDRLVGVDSRGRWVLARSATVTTQLTTRSAEGKTLVIDPTLPDPTPRLPGWTIANTRESGWTPDGWPAINVDGKYYRLKDRGWERPDPKKKPDSFVTIALGTKPTTGPTDLLTTADGTRYFDGTTTLRRVTKAGVETVWPLPAKAQGSAPVYLVQSPDGALLLMNTPGRIVRLKSSPDRPAELTVDGVFTRKVPNGLVRRFWLDPAGRLCIAHDEAGLTVLFPTGVIPKPIRDMMPVSELEE